MSTTNDYFLLKAKKRLQQEQQLQEEVPSSDSPVNGLSTTPSDSLAAFANNHIGVALNGGASGDKTKGVKWSHAMKKHLQEVCYTRTVKIGLIFERSSRPIEVGIIDPCANFPGWSKSRFTASASRHTQYLETGGFFQHPLPGVEEVFYSDFSRGRCQGNFLSGSQHDVLKDRKGRSGSRRASSRS